VFRKERLLKQVPLIVRDYLRRHENVLLHKVDVTHVALSKDLSNIDVYCYWSDVMDLLDVLRVEKPKVRNLIAKIGFKKVPDVRFFYDKGEKKKRELLEVMKTIEV